MIGELLLPSLTFAAGVFSGKLIELAADKVAARIGRLEQLGDVRITYRQGEATTHIVSSEDAVWVDVPFDVHIALYNCSRQRRVLHNPRVSMSLPMDVRNDAALYTSEMTFLTTLADGITTVDPDSANEVTVRGWASFRAQRAEIPNLHRAVGLALNNVGCVNLTFTSARPRRDVSFRADRAKSKGLDVDALCDRIASQLP